MQNPSISRAFWRTTALHGNGLFDIRENLNALRFCRPPSILKGSNAGEAVEVDHRISVKDAPELSISPANLILSPASINSSRGAPLDQRARKAAEDFQRETDWRPSPELAKKLSADR